VTDLRNLSFSNCLNATLRA